MDKEIVYVAELDADVDDVVAAHYLHDKGVLKCVVCDPYPKTEAGLKRKAKLESLASFEENASDCEICIRWWCTNSGCKLY